MLNQSGYPSVDKPWLKYFEGSDNEIEKCKCSIWRNIYNHNKDHLNEIALLYYGRKITYGEMFKNIDTLQNVFMKQGVRSDDRVAFFILSCPEMIYSLLALNKIGAMANMINPTFTAEQIRGRINDSGAEIIIVLDQIYERLQTVINDICPKKIIVVKIEESMPTIVKMVAHGKLKKNIEYNSRVIEWKDFIKGYDRGGCSGN